MYAGTIHVLNSTGQVYLCVHSSCTAAVDLSTRYYVHNHTHYGCIIGSGTRIAVSYYYTKPGAVTLWIIQQWWVLSVGFNYSLYKAAAGRTCNILQRGVVAKEWARQRKNANARTW